MEAEMRIKALANHLEIEIDEIQSTKYDEKILEVGNDEYLIVTDQEADDIWDERLESYIDECILPDIPEHARNYFDNESWKVDAQMDGRGHAISSYDGCEYDIEIDGEILYIFRLN